MLWSIVFIESPIQLLCAVQWVGKWGILGGIQHWLASAWIDPVYAAALVDFVCLIAIGGIALATDYRARGGAWNVWFFLWSLIYLVFPSLGAAFYFLFLQPARRQELQSAH